MLKDYYAILGLGKEADAKQIKAAYYQVTAAAASTSVTYLTLTPQLAKKYHPDTNAGNKEAAKKFQEISEAYTVCCCYRCLIIPLDDRPTHRC